MKSLWAALALAFVWVDLGLAAGLTKERLVAKYKAIKYLRAEIVQEKRASYLLQPLLSQITLTYDQDQLTWKVTQPAASEIVLTPDQKILLDGKALPPAQGQTQRALLGIITLARQLVKGDIAAIEQQYQVIVKQDLMEMTPKPNQGIPGLKQMMIKFDADANLESIAFDLADEKINLLFRSVSYKPGKGS